MQTIRIHLLSFALLWFGEMAQAQSDLHSCLIRNEYYPELQRAWCSSEGIYAWKWGVVYKITYGQHYTAYLANYNLSSQTESGLSATDPYDSEQIVDDRAKVQWLNSQWQRVHHNSCQAQWRCVKHKMSSLTYCQLREDYLVIHALHDDCKHKEINHD